MLFDMSSILIRKKKLLCHLCHLTFHARTLKASADLTGPAWSPQRLHQLLGPWPHFIPPGLWVLAPVMLQLRRAPAPPQLCRACPTCRPTSPLSLGLPSAPRKGWIYHGSPWLGQRDRPAAKLWSWPCWTSQWHDRTQPPRGVNKGSNWLVLILSDRRKGG